MTTATTKELFETVMGFKVHEYQVTSDEIRYYPASSPRARCFDWKPTLSAKSIIEFAFIECKRYCIENEFTIESAYFPKGKFTSSFARIHRVITAREVERFHADTEAEAVIKATQYVVELING